MPNHAAIAPVRSGSALPSRLSATVATCLVAALGAAAQTPRAQTPRAQAPQTQSLAAADALWRARAEGHGGGEPEAGPILRAIEAYEAVVEAQPTDLEARWKLLRAQQFLGEHVLEARDDKLALFEGSRAFADESRRLLLAADGLTEGETDTATIARTLRGSELAAAIYYYSAVHWGLWGDTTGRLEAARAGVGSRLRDFGAMVVAIDERFDEAAGHRLLGRLHTEAPRIPLVTGWVDRDVAVTELDRACEIAPQNPFNQLYLADALLRFDASRRQEAIERLTRVAASEPRPHRLVEEMEAVAEARRLLESIRE